MEAGMVLVADGADAGVDVVEEVGLADGQEVVDVDYVVDCQEEKLGLAQPGFFVGKHVLVGVWRGGEAGKQPVLKNLRH